jgi:hypothetical protein
MTYQFEWEEPAIMFALSFADSVAWTNPIHYAWHCGLIHTWVHKLSAECVALAANLHKTFNSISTRQEAQAGTYL